ncbi:MAG: hypothetical protein VX460_12640 [Planctomycetota bacterium]|nr:hypothetical protein [Planctomycetota bacterium]
MIAVALAAAAAVSCRATSVAYRFAPSPLETLVEDGEGGPVVARVLVGIPGAEREGRSQDGMPLLLVRMRIENKSEAPLDFDPARALLLGSDLARFGAARLEAPEPTEGPIRIGPGESRGMLLRFPFPRDGSLDAPLLTGVNLQFELGRETGDLELSVSLERNELPEVGDPGPNVVVGGGYYWGAGPGWWWGRW